MSTTPVEEAILASHRKDSEVRSTCAVSDRILLNVRKEYQFPLEPERWAVGLAERLEMLNKDYRRTIRSNTQTLRTRLQNLYGRSAAAGLAIDAAAAQELGTEGLSLILVPKPNQSEKTEQTADLMCDLLTRVDVALKLCMRVEGLVPQMTGLYRTRGQGGTVPVLQRVLLRRNMSKFQRGLVEISAHKQRIQGAMEEWRPYFEVLASETALDQLLNEVHAQKVSKKAFLNEVIPVVERFRALRDKRDDIINRSSVISLAHEANWLPLGSIQLPNSLVARQLREYDVLLEDAKKQEVAHAEVLRSLEVLNSRSMSPLVVVGPGGVDITLSRLAIAYVEIREVYSTCSRVMKLAMPFISALEFDIKTLCKLDEDEDAVIE